MATLTVYPDAGTGATTCDARTYRETPGTWAQTRDGAGITAAPTATNDVFVQQNHSSGAWQTISRGIFVFDTSGIGTGQTISAAVLSLFCTAGDTTLGSTPIHVASATPATNNSIIAADFTQIGRTSFASVAHSAITLAAYNAWTLSAGGIANIAPTGISKFSTQLDGDLTNVEPSIAGSPGQEYIIGNYADVALTTTDPKLVVTYAAAGGTEPGWVSSRGGWW